MFIFRLQFYFSFVVIRFECELDGVLTVADKKICLGNGTGLNTVSVGGEFGIEAITQYID